ncbi:type II toxin-antitoxin system HipA family toxin [Agrococcus sp. SCSIO52902]|uniref:type II toxin-antitoxin system HipA family toxin n=1 Tax=Agrococcus sp. SCSIO52902 TaxID=2933290 RepID=UPI001FF1B9CD|nr:type II toxin-antitoxin system HipA family toxin [Agrococcus sp. SCSIO52902]UOW01839.1 type II toxin-antitoxin system HipA family toxin [Agrococcus sp. SCSIO52902]
MPDRSLTARHTVFLGESRVGSLLQRDHASRFLFDEDYWERPDRGVLGRWFEDNPGASPQAQMRLPRWFSNLLPEGPLRRFIALDRGVAEDRELQLLLRIGDDLPGAVRVVEGEFEDLAEHLLASSGEATQERGSEQPAWKFSLAGVSMKFSMLKQADRMTLPAVGEHGDWIVKLPDSVFPHVPSNEFWTMTFAGSVGLDVPTVTRLHRDELPRLPDAMWPNGEEWAFGIERFDRTVDGRRVHIEDFNQVRNFAPSDKYEGSFETVAALAYKAGDERSLLEFVRRLSFCVLAGNGDAHLKNWSFIYRNPMKPTLSPVYDLVSTAGYWDSAHHEDLGLHFARSRRFGKVSRSSFTRLARRLGVNADLLTDVVDETVERFVENWCGSDTELLPEGPRAWIESRLGDAASRLTRER